MVLLIMSGSLYHGKEDIAQWVKNNNIETVLDVGCGSGTYSDLFRSFDINFKKIDGVEVFSDLVHRYSLFSKYNNVYIKNAKDITNWDYDLTIFGDVIEHMSLDEGKFIWNLALLNSKNIIAAIPIGLCKQGPYYYDKGTKFYNPYQEHVIHYKDVDSVLKNFPGIYKYTVYNLENDEMINNDIFSIVVFYAKK